MTGRSQDRLWAELVRWHSLVQRWTEFAERAKVKALRRSVVVAVQRPGLIVESVYDEVAVFDPAMNAATALNASAAAVFGLCDGNHTLADMREALDAAGLDAAGDDAVWLALDELAEAGLIDLLVPPTRHLSRREMLSRYSLGAAALAALPVVESISAPFPAAAGSPGISPSPSTVAPTPSPSTVAPTPSPSTVAPTPSPSTVAPTPAPSTVAPTPAPL
jgi:hypothetical protein